jgi:hypothetical protein
MWRSVLLVLLVGAMASAQDSVGDGDGAYPSEGEGVVGLLIDAGLGTLLTASNYWKMEEAGTNDRVDSIGTDDLTPDEAITTTAGQKNNAANFDASTESMTSTTWRAVGWTGFTVSAWLRRADFPATNGWFAVENTASNPSIGFYIRNDGEASGWIRNNSVTIQVATTGSFNTPVDTQWVHYCLSWNTDDNVFLYIDGVERGVSGSPLSGTLLDNDVGIRFGSHPTDVLDWAGGNEGYTDEVAFFDYGIGLVGCGDIYNDGEGKFLP